MNRIALTDNSGAWFDEDKATGFDEKTRWNGSNRISVNTGSQWDHEKLYRTASGRWVLNVWSQWQGSIPSYAEIPDEDAIRWLIVNETDIDEVPEDIRDLVSAGFADAEL